jgi:hypothetical protein
MQTTYENNYRISTNFRSPRGERSKINQFNQFMQNKPNFRKAKMNVSPVITKHYEKRILGEHGKNKPN